MPALLIGKDVCMDDILIAGRLSSTTVDGVLALSSGVYDPNLKKMQSEINASLNVGRMEDGDIEQAIEDAFGASV